MLILALQPSAISRHVHCIDGHGACNQCRAVPHLDITHGIKPIQLVEQLKHGALDLTLSTTVCVIPLCADCINLICTPACT
jgi:hypothetical protein